MLISRKHRRFTTTIGGNGWNYTGLIDAELSKIEPQEIYSLLWFGLTRIPSYKSTILLPGAIRRISVILWSPLSQSRKPLCQACHCLNRSASSRISRRFFSKRAKAMMIRTPKTIPATSHSPFQLRLTDAVRIIANNDSSRNAVPR